MKDELQIILDTDYENKLIKLSQMVEDGKLSTTAAKKVFQEIRQWYLKMQARI
jgi:polyhydroxyalkanoate synthesis regulator phasin